MFQIISQILYPISKLPDFEALVKSAEGHTEVTESREALQKVLFEYASARQQIHARLMKVRVFHTGIILGVGSANERRRYNVTSSLIG